MDETQLQLQRADVRRLLSAGSGDAALLYLYLQNDGTKERAAADLQLSPQRTETAYALLRQIGLISDPVRFLRPSEPPAYSDNEVMSSLREDNSFRGLLDDIQQRLGRMLGNEDLKILLSIRNYLGLPDEVISILTSFCKERGKARGNIKAPSMRTIEKEAYVWADNGIESMEAAVAYVQQQMGRQSRFGGIRRAMQINNRRLTVTEENFIVKWLEAGFGEPEIALAYEKTCVGTGGLNWKYMDGILNSWKSQGLFTVEQIEKHDSQPQKRGENRQHREDSGDEVDPIVKKILENRRRQKGDA